MNDPIEACVIVTKKRLPAFARPLDAARRQGLVPARNEVIVALDVWRWGQPQNGRHARVVVPSDLQPASADFRFLAGLDALVAWDSRITAGARVMELAKCLVAVEPRRLWLLDMSPSATARVQWIVSESGGIEVAP